MRNFLAEAVGTFVLVFGGVGSAVLAGTHVGYLGVSFAFGLSLLAMVYTIGPISGCHINPAVTLGVLLVKKMTGKQAAAYMLAQTLGAIVAASLILLIAQGSRRRLRCICCWPRSKWLWLTFSRAILDERRAVRRNHSDNDSCAYRARSD